MIRILLLLELLFLGFAATDAAGDAGEIARGDSAFARLDNPAALQHYQLALAEDSSNYQALWKLARAHIDVGEQLEDKQERRQHYQAAVKLARRAVQVDSLGEKGHLFLSIALGRIALDAGARERVRLSREIKEEVDRALALDSTDDVAWHVLGRWHRKIATLNWIERNFAKIFLGGVPKGASVERAAECLQKAVELKPTSIQHHYQLAVTYEELKEEEQARREYQNVLQLPITDADDPRHIEWARRRLEKLH